MQNSKPKRLGLFSFAGYEGVVDDYIVALLSKLQFEVGQLAVMCDGTLTQQGREKLQAFTDKIFVREADGARGRAFGALIKELGGDYLEQFDEVVLFDDSFYGPMFPLGTMFEEMGARGLDFWGVTSVAPMLYKQEGEGYKTAAAFLQTYFVVIARPMFTSAHFAQFWQLAAPTVQNPFFDNSFEHGFMSDDVDPFKHVSEFERSFTNYFEQHGYKWQAYVPTAQGAAYNGAVFEPYNILQKHNCPFLLKSALCISKSDQTISTQGLQPQKALNFVRSETDYDADLITTNLVRTVPNCNVAGALCLNAIVDDAQGAAPDGDVALIARVETMDMAKKLGAFAANLPQGSAIFLSAQSEDIKTAALNFIGGRLNVKAGQMHDGLMGLVSLLANYKNEIARHKYGCILVEPQRSKFDTELLIGERNDFALQNALASREYVANVMQLFAQNKHMGVLAVAHSQMALYNYEKSLDVERLAGMLQTFFTKSGKSAPLWDMSEPINGSTCWYKTEALFDVLYNYITTAKTPVMGDVVYAASYLAQSEGYYSTTLLHKNYVASQLAGLNYYSAAQRGKIVRLREHIGQLHFTLAPDRQPFSKIIKGVVVKILRRLGIFEQVYAGIYRKKYKANAFYKEIDLKLNDVGGRDIAVILAPMFTENNIMDGFFQRISAIDELISANNTFNVYIETEYNGAQPLIRYIDDNHLHVVLNVNSPHQEETLFDIVRRAKYVHIHSAYRLMESNQVNKFRERLFKTPALKVWDMHGAAPEEEVLMGNHYAAQNIHAAEQFLCENADIIVCVNNAMKRHIIAKWPEAAKRKFIILPIFKEDFLQAIDCEQDKTLAPGQKPLCVYAGGAQKWQELPLMQNIIEKAGDKYRYAMYLPDPGIFTQLWGNRVRPADMEVARKTPQQLALEYRRCHYGFLLRADNVINRVACPTKLIEYIRFGIVPIMYSPHVGDFEELGLKYISHTQFAAGELPSEQQRIAMARENTHIFDELIAMYESGKGQLSAAVASSKGVRNA